MIEETDQRPAVGPVTRLLEQKKERKPQFHHYPDYFMRVFGFDFLHTL
ncbi:hypothetical protein [Enterococcus avium]|nr:hypothetical protein [Enterococcus avium]MDT2511317.1 hypothetical protein [Enterococcus avium]